jgi:hypothetical protein
MVFAYPDQPCERRHGPCGYQKLEGYKPWLRDEFCFRCFYCLCRERWLPDGAGSFSIDHLMPLSQAPELRTEYDNLIYACVMCNSLKQAEEWPTDPLADPAGKHLQVREDGVVECLTRIGYDMIRICRLNRPALVRYRRTLMKVLAFLHHNTAPEAAVLLRQYLGFPDDLPRLRNLRPPDGNRRPEGINQSWYERQRRGELPETY